MLDRMLFRNAEGETVLELQAEDAPPLPPEMIATAPAQRFRVIGDGAAASKLTGRINHVGQEITYVRPGWADVAAGRDAAAFIHLFCGDTARRPGLDLQSDQRRAVLVTRRASPGWWRWSAMRASLGGQAQAACSSSLATVSGAPTSPHLRGRISAAAPISASSAPTAYVAIIIDPGHGHPSDGGRDPLMLQGGRLEMDLAGFGEITAGLTELQSLFDRYVARARTPSARHRPPAEAPALTAERTVPIAATEDTERDPVFKLDRSTWTATGPTRWWCCCARLARPERHRGDAVELRGGWRHALHRVRRPRRRRGLEVLVGADDEHIHVLDAATRRWSGCITPTCRCAWAPQVCASPAWGRWRWPIWRATGASTSSPG